MSSGGRAEHASGSAPCRRDGRASLKASRSTLLAVHSDNRGPPGERAARSISTEWSLRRRSAARFRAGPYKLMTNFIPCNPRATSDEEDEHDQPPGSALVSGSDKNYFLRALISLPIDLGIGFLHCLIVPGSKADTTQTYVAPHRQQLYIFADVPT